MVEEKLVLSRSPAPGIQTALIWNQSVDYSTLIQAPAAGAACWEAILIIEKRIGQSSQLIDKGNEGN